MVKYRIGGQILGLPDSLEELQQYEIHDHEVDAAQADSFTNGISNLAPTDKMYMDLYGWVGGKDRRIELWSSLPGILLRVDDGSDFYVSPDGHTITRHDAGGSKGKIFPFDREILLGLASILALAICKTWSLHGSAATYNGKTFAFLAETGTGKSTLAAYLSKQMNWNLVADDILPVTGNEDRVIAWPHFPQLKLSMDAQPSTYLPEQIPLNMLCELVRVDADVSTDIKRLPPKKAVKVLLGHTAGSRLFTEKMLEDHLSFCAQASEVVPVYRLIYPHSQNALPEVKEMLEILC